MNIRKKTNEKQSKDQFLCTEDEREKDVSEHKTCELNFYDHLWVIFALKDVS